MNEDVCKYWHEDGEPLREVCRASCRNTICGGRIKYCEWPKQRREKEGE